MRRGDAARRRAVGCDGVRSPRATLRLLPVVCLLILGWPATATRCHAQEAPAAAPAAPRKAAPVAGKVMVTLDVLALRRDLWPQQVALTRPQAFEQNESLDAGVEVWLQEFVGEDLRVDAGTFLFLCPASETDVLSRAQSLVDSLTAEQLALGWSDIRGRSELWPLRVVLTSTVELADGTTFVPGCELAVRDLNAEGLSVSPPDSAVFFSVDPEQTDLFPTARERLRLPEAERQPFFVRSLAAALRPRVDGAASSLAEAEFVLVYRGRLGCGRCAALTPELRASVERLLADGSRVALVAVSNDARAEDAAAWLDEARLPGDAVAWDRRLQAATLATLSIDQLPGLFVFDRTGRLLDRNDSSGGTPTAREVLARFETRVRNAVPGR